MKKLNRILTFALTAALGFISTGCASTDSSSGSAETQTTAGSTASVSESTSEDLKTVRIGTSGADATALAESAYVAQKLGYFDEELKKVGYKPEYVPFGQGGTAVNEGLASEQIDYAVMGDAPEVVAKSNGLDVQLIASLNSESVMGLFVGKDSGIKSVKDLKGKKVVIAYGTVTHKYLIDILSENNLSINDVQVINDIANAATLVASGDADALVLPGAAVYMYEAKGMGTVISSSVDDPAKSAQFLVMGRTQYINENPDTAVAINKALLRVKEYAENNYEDFLKIYSDPNKIPTDVYAAIYPKEQGFDKFNPEITDNSKKKLSELSKFFVENKVTTKDIDVDSFVNNEYYEKAVKEFNEEK